MSKRSILYVFRRPVTKEIENAYQHDSPRDIFYGLTEINKYCAVKVSDKVFKSRTLLFSQHLLNIFVTKFITLGLSLFPAIYLLKDLNRSDIIFATVDTYGLPIALLKFLKLVRKPLVFNTIGLYDGLLTMKNPLILYFYQQILRAVDHFVAGGSFQECKKLAKMLKFPLSKFSFIPFGIDTDFFTPKKILSNNEILIIGADPSRDWQLYAKIARNFPQETFRVVTYPYIVKHDMPKNVVFEYNLSYLDLRQRIWEAKYLLILSKFNYHFAGQSTAMRAMSCGKAVIFTESPGVEEYQFQNLVHCLKVPVSDEYAVYKAIHFLNTYQAKRSKIERNARRIIVESYSIEKYGQKLRAVFDQIKMELHG